MDIGFIRGLVTLLVFVLFIGIAAWAYSAKRKSDFEDAANLPLDDAPRSGDNHNDKTGEQS